MTTLDFYLNDVWKKTLDGVYSSRQISESMFNDYLLSTRLTSLDDEYAYILCPTYIHFTIVDQYREVVEFYLEQVLGKHLLLKIQQQSLLDAQKETVTPDVASSPANSSALIPVQVWRRGPATKPPSAE